MGLGPHQGGFFFFLFLLSLISGARGIHSGGIVLDKRDYRRERRSLFGNIIIVERQLLTADTYMTANRLSIPLPQSAIVGILAILNDQTM